MPAPSSTPKIPITGLWDRSTGNAARPEGGPPVDLLAGTAMEIALIRFLFCFHGDYSRKSRTQPGSKGRIIERDLNRHSLYNFGEISGCIVRRQQCELRPAGWCDLEYFSFEDLVRININTNLDRVADFNIGQLRLAEICLHPSSAFHKCHDLGSWGHELPRPNLPLTNGPIVRRGDAR